MSQIMVFSLNIRCCPKRQLCSSWSIKDYWKGKYRDVSAKSIIIFFIALAYIISPLDLIPDYIIGLGQIDDAVILGLSLYFLEKDLRKYKEWKDRNG